MEEDIGNLRCCSFFLCGVAVNKISACGVAVISNPTVCDVCALLKSAVFGVAVFCLNPYQI